MNKNVIMGTTTIMIVVIFSCIFIYGLISPPIPQQTLDQVTSAYLDAVQQQDLRTLNRLCLPENIDCNNDMPNRLKMYTGWTLHNIRISYHPTENSFYWGVSIRATGTNKKNQTTDINDSFSVRKVDPNPMDIEFLRDNRWYITIPPKNPHPLPSNGAPASIITPTPSTYPDPRSYSPQSYPYPSP